MMRKCLVGIKQRAERASINWHHLALLALATPRRTHGHVRGQAHSQGRKVMKGWPHLTNYRCCWATRRG